MGDISNTTEKIKIVLIKCGMTQKELAEKLGISQPTLSGKFKLNDWRESDLQKIAQICGCKYEGFFKTEDWEV